MHHSYSAGAGAGTGTGTGAGGGDNGAPSVSTLASWGSKAALVWFGLMFLLGSHLRVRGRGRRAGSGNKREQGEAERTSARCKFDTLGPSRSGVVSSCHGAISIVCVSCDTQ